MTGDARRDAPAGTRWLFVATLLLVAILVRISVMFYGSLFPDEATVGLVAKRMLRGEDFPAFFYRQTYMGSLNGIHLAPALFVFGPSVLLVRLNAIAWSLLFPLGLYLLGRRIFDEATGRAALALAAVSPFLLTYWSTVAEPHFETNVFGVWLLLLALAALTAPSESARIRALAVFGLVAGLAWWTNFKVIEILAPTLALLAFRDPRALLGRGWALFAGGFLVGGLPAWLFYALHGTRGTAGQTASADKFLGISLAQSVARFWDGVPPLLGTYRWALTTPLRQAVFAVNVALYVAAVGLAVWEALRRRRRREPLTARDWGIWLLLLTLPAEVGALCLSPGLGVLGRGASSRYVLPAFIALLVFAGALVAQTWRRSRALGAAVLIFFLSFHIWTLADFLWPFSPMIRAGEAAAHQTRAAVRESLAARPVDAFYVDDPLPALAWAFLLDRPTVSALDTEIYVPSAVTADAAERIAILARGGAGVAESLGALGATWRAKSIHGWQLYEDIRVPARAYRLVPRRGWRVEGDPAIPPSVGDGELATAWPPPSEPRRPGDRLVLDVGRPYPVARVILWPSLATSRVFPLRLSGSADGAHWESLSVVPGAARRAAFVASGRPVFRPRNGWLEVAMTPRPLRYLRLEPAEPVGSAPWGISEVQLYEEAGESPPVVPDVDALVARLRAQGVDRLLADPVVSARVARATGGAVQTLIANGVVDNHGAAPPPWLAQPVRLRARDALLVPVEDAPDLGERLAAAGVEVLAEPLGAHVLVRVLAPLGSPAPCRRLARRAITADPGSADRLLIESWLDDDAVLSGLTFRHPPGAARTPRVVDVSLARGDGTWERASRARMVPAWGWGGRTLFAASDGVTEVVFDPTLARAVQVTMAGVDTSDLAVHCVRGTPRG